MRRALRPLFGLAAALATATTALAQDAPCENAQTDAVPAFEAAKSAMLQGDYETFYKLSTPHVPDAESRKPQLIGPLQSALPGGFKSCWTVVERFEEPGLYQDVTFFDSGAGPVGLYLLGAVYKGEITIMHFAYSQVPSDMLDNLK
ncbi:MAG: hypothetical protein HKN63_07160 [Rhodobacteraceae bacterium]|nr:hypothetical protein [Paracoccaceae bacterium]